MKFLYGILGALVLSLAFTVGMWRGMVIQQGEDDIACRRVAADLKRVSAELAFVEGSRDEWHKLEEACLDAVYDKQAELARLRRNRAILQPFFETGRLAVLEQKEP